jgi:iron complex outermembrane receptor protein
VSKNQNQFSNLGKEKKKSPKFRTGYPHFDELFASCDYSDAEMCRLQEFECSDATRVNVTINGIPYNDSESHGTYWVNMLILSSVEFAIAAG